jgi:hypothetical protein
MDKTQDLTNYENNCFIICPIGEENTEARMRSDKVLKHIISPAAKEHDLLPVRSDQIAVPGMITTHIIRQIINAKMVVADLTDHNPNVFYELALRHAFRKPVIQIIEEGQKIPFDVYGTRVIKYTLDLDGASIAKEAVINQITNALSNSEEIDSPVSIAAKLEDLTKSSTPEYQVLMQSILSQIDELNKKLIDMSGSICKPDDIKNSIPPVIKDQIAQILHQYSEEIGLLKSVRFAGITGIYKRREMALRAFSRALDEETNDIMVIGSSLKGLLQKEEYKEISNKLKFKSQQKFSKVRFVLTHPIVADFRANQENRRTTEIGIEIINSLEILRDWGIDSKNVRLYLGTPTCFAIKTTRQMLINPYPYVSVALDSPCLILEYSPDSGSDRPGYFYDEFNSRHFGVWDTELSVHIRDFNETINYCRNNLEEFASRVEDIITKGKSFK